MNEPVIDASALLAILLHEPVDTLDRLLDHAVISAVNLAEVKTKLVDLDQVQADALGIELLRLIRVIDFNQEQAMLAASLRRQTRHAGLSLGDRACLALAISRGADVYTADRNWLRVDVPCKVYSIR